LGITANRAREKDEPGIKMLIPNFQRGDNHVVMLEIAVPPGRGSREVAQVFVKYKDVASRANREVTTAARVEYTPDRAAMVASTRRPVKKNLLAFQTGEALTQAAALIQQGKASEAAKALDERMVVLGLAAREWRDADLDSDGKLLGQYRDVVVRLHRHPETMASNSLGEYVAKSLTFGGYQRCQ
jgi:Ca-activated chloride channel family protein